MRMYRVKVNKRLTSGLFECKYYVTVEFQGLRVHEEFVARMFFRENAANEYAKKLKSLFRWVNLINMNEYETLNPKKEEINGQQTYLSNS